MMLAGVLASAQELEPRRWSHLPTDVNYAGAAYAYTKADVLFDPVLELEDVEMDLQTLAVKVLRTFEVLDRSARAEVLVPYQTAEWEGLLRGESASTSRTGLADPSARVAVNLAGGPPLSRKDFPAYRASHPVETIVGLGFTLRAPLGEYREEKLLNLGENRFSFKSELGVEHTRGKLISELTGSATLFTDNDEFWNGNELEQAPLYVAQGHLAYTFRPGFWAGGGVAYMFGGESTINGDDKHDEKGNIVSGCSVGVPISRAIGARIGYINTHTQKDTGSDSDTVAVSVSAMW